MESVVCAEQKRWTSEKSNRGSLRPPPGFRWAHGIRSLEVSSPCYNLVQLSLAHGQRTFLSLNGRFLKALLRMLSQVIEWAFGKVTPSGWKCGWLRRHTEGDRLGRTIGRVELTWLLAPGRDVRTEGMSQGSVRQRLEGHSY